MFNSKDKRNIKVTLTESLIEALSVLMIKKSLTNITTILDSNTYPSIGAAVHKALTEKGITNRNIILSGTEVIPNEYTIMSVLVDIELQTEAIIAIGSGTITNIARFVSHRLKIPFIVIPTAPSMDGYTGHYSSIFIRGFKRNISCHPPLQILTSPSILANAPQRLIVAGFGTVMGMICTIADWKLAKLLADDFPAEEIVSKTEAICSKIVEKAIPISRREATAISDLFLSLVQLEKIKTVNPGSTTLYGSSHQIADFLEMREQVNGKSGIPYGIKLAVGSLLSANWYHSLKTMSKETVKKQPLQLPAYEELGLELVSFLGEPGYLMLERNTSLSTMDTIKIKHIRNRLFEHWEEVQQIAEDVPKPKELLALLKRAGGPTNLKELGLSGEDVQQAGKLCHCVHNAFTIRTLFYVMGFPALQDLRLF